MWDRPYSDFSVLTAAPSGHSNLCLCTSSLARAAANSVLARSRPEGTCPALCGRQILAILGVPSKPVFLLARAAAVRCYATRRTLLYAELAANVTQRWHAHARHLPCVARHRPVLKAVVRSPAKRALFRGVRLVVTRGFDAPLLFHFPLCVTGRMFKLPLLLNGAVLVAVALFALDWV